MRRLRGALTGKLSLEEKSDHSGAIINVKETGYFGISDVDGNFIISGIPTGTYDLAISKNGYEEKKIEGIKIEANSLLNVTNGSTITLFLQRGEVEGYVFLEGKTDHGGVIVSVEGSGKTGLTDSYGHYLVSLVPVGTYNLKFKKEGFDEEVVTDVMITRGFTIPVTDVFLQLSRGSIAGVAILEGASNHSGILISIEGTNYTAITNSNGNYLIQGIPVGRYNLMASKSGYDDATVSGVVVNTNKTTNLSPITLNFIPGEIRGVALKKDKTNHANIHVYLEGHSYLDAFTDLDGNFTIKDVPAGTYSLVAVAPEPDYIPYHHPSPITLSAGETKDIGTFTVLRPPYPPIPVYIYQSEATGVTLGWYPNNPTDELSGFNIYRSSYENPAPVLLNSSPLPVSNTTIQEFSTEVTDETVYYFFYITAIDNNNLESNTSEKMGFELMPYYVASITSHPMYPFNGPYDIAIEKDEQNVFVTNSFGQYVSVIDTSQEMVTSTVDFSLYGNPQGIVSSPITDAVYVGVEDTGFLIIDTKTLEMAGPYTDFALGEHRVAITPDGGRLFVDADADGGVYGWYLTAPTSPELIPDCFPCGGGYPDCSPKEMTVAKNKLYIMCYSSGKIKVVDIDEGSDTKYQVLKDINLPSQSENLEVSLDGNYLIASITFYSGNPSPDIVVIYETQTDKYIGSIEVGNMSRGVCPSENGFYVANDSWNSILSYAGFNHLEVYLYRFGPAGSISTPDYSTACSATRDRKKVYVIRGPENDVIVRWFE